MCVKHLLNESERPKRERALTEFVGWRTSDTIKRRLKAVADAKGVTPSTLMTMVIVSGLDEIQREMLAV